MRPRRILTIEETTRIIDHAVRERALCVLSVQNDWGWHTFKSHMLERSSDRKWIVLDYQKTHGCEPPPLVPGQYLSVSFRHKSRKVMFVTVVEALGQFRTGSRSIPAVRYRWPETLMELQRRAYHRTPIPNEMELPVRLWAGGAARHLPDDAVLSGQALDLSCGGMLVQLDEAAEPQWSENQTLGVELSLPDGAPPLLVDAHFRGLRPGRNGGTSVAVQFVGLEMAPEGRGALHRLANCLRQLHRQQMGEARLGWGQRYVE